MVTIRFHNKEKSSWDIVQNISFYILHKVCGVHEAIDLISGRTIPLNLPETAREMKTEKEESDRKREQTNETQEEKQRGAYAQTGAKLLPMEKESKILNIKL